ncbi:uncharacterized protein LOC126899112 [Daktulosphaira vitifoliae]|uniref:uncharacterized protein LOC126899112 n=1 Tax=Daktulosphaira vitifoliae TaxID=58002 RepID=UPI0021AA30D2|nr:uncharacterized protein LOC126899112 [Daktulosphaira vitifoliae]
MQFFALINDCIALSSNTVDYYINLQQELETVKKNTIFKHNNTREIIDCKYKEIEFYEKIKDPQNLFRTENLLHLQQILSSYQIHTQQKLLKEINWFRTCCFSRSFFCDKHLSYFKQNKFQKDICKNVKLLKYKNVCKKLLKKLKNKKKLKKKALAKRYSRSIQVNFMDFSEKISILSLHEQSKLNPYRFSNDWLRLGMCGTPGTNDLKNAIERFWENIK